MPPTVHIRLDGPGACNGSTITGRPTNGPCIISVRLANLTLGLGGDEGGAELTSAQQDGQGAMQFIIAVLLVYSLMGTAGMLILRIRRSATKAHNNKTLAAKEANLYLKYRDKIDADCHRARLVRETNKVLNHIQALERQKSLTESVAPTSYAEEEGQLSPFLPSESKQQSKDPGQIHTSSLTSTQNKAFQRGTADIMTIPSLDQPSSVFQHPLSFASTTVPTGGWRDPDLELSRFVPPDSFSIKSDLAPPLGVDLPSVTNRNTSLDLAHRHVLPTPTNLDLAQRHFLATPTNVTPSLATPTSSVTETIIEEDGECAASDI